MDVFCCTKMPIFVKKCMHFASFQNSGGVSEPLVPPADAHACTPAFNNYIPNPDTWNYNKITRIFQITIWQTKQKNWTKI